MKLRKLRDPVESYKPQITVFGGLNTTPSAREGEIINCLNIDTSMLPCLAPVKGATDISFTADCIYMARKLCSVNGVTFYYDKIAKGIVTGGHKSMVDFNGKIVIFPDKKFYDTVGDTFGDLATQAGTYPAAGTIPSMDHICAYMNRVFGVKGNNLYASALGNCRDFTTFAGLNTDAYAVDVDSPGDFTGIVDFQNHVVLFKSHMMYELYGAYPKNFSLKEVAKIGCISMKSVTEVNGMLYFVAQDGLVYEYGGGLPRPVSQNISTKFTSVCCAGSDGRKYFVSQGALTYVYDTFTGLWSKEFFYNATEYSRSPDGALYFIGAGKVYTANTGVYDPWFAELHPITEQDMNKKYYPEIKIRYNLLLGSSLTIYHKLSNAGEWIQDNVITASVPMEQSVGECIIRPQRCDALWLRFDGTGYGRIYSIERKYSVSGGD